MTKKKKFNFKFLIGLVFYLGFLYFFFTKLDIKSLDIILSSSIWPLVFVAVACELFLIGTNAYLLKKIFKLYGISIAYRAALDLWLLAVASSAFTAGISGPVIIYLKAKQISQDGIVALRAAASLFFVLLVPNILFIFISSALFFQRSEYFDFASLLEYILFAAILVIFIYLVFEIIRSLPVKKSIIHWLDRYQGLFESENLKIIFSRQAINVYIISLVRLLLNLLVFVLAIAGLGAYQNIPITVKNFAINQAIAIFSPSNGGLGFVEVGLTASLAANGIGQAHAAITVLVYRIIDFWLPFILGGAVFSLHYLKAIKNRHKDNKDKDPSKSGFLL